MTETIPTDIIRVHELSKSYLKDIPVLHSISLNLTQGECLGIVGESGSGKSTLARCLLTLSDWDSGAIYFHNQHLKSLGKKKLREARLRMGAVFQNPTAALNSRIRIIDSLMEPLEQRKGFLPTFIKKNNGTDRKDIAAELLQIVGLPSEYLSKYPHELSGGEKQRVTIARAISTEPSFIVLDEPTASLDVTTQSVILNLLKDLQENYGLSYLFISHDLAAVHFMSQRIIVMKNGHILDSFPKAQTFDTNRHKYTKLLLDVFSG
ncbi:ABC transporter ATP-binding protein [Paenibacillus wynnii]|uniref:ABC transporter ATP-binding protein n=1 Tax=Paenibacillus wynnii TaxID=268407 RepID=UPI0027923F96|nr:dipeptide/oligopeptide/nickel ABC transporter ATP-binding protein [Paenibacillus wynnii]MDQ0195636.1 ABC-type glutathione transport system ATPase component [Paenibacillus wynnii]